MIEIVIVLEKVATIERVTRDPISSKKTKHEKKNKNRVITIEIQNQRNVRMLFTIPISIVMVTHDSNTQTHNHIGEADAYLDCHIYRSLESKLNSVHAVSMHIAQTELISKQKKIDLINIEHTQYTRTLNEQMPQIDFQTGSKANSK